ncbi:hypothetical protein TNCV_5135851 [Trichonephila clavipes]|nr:hypothetical protein TNCV_5135851 [Trichonephila clavipes]
MFPTCNDFQHSYSVRFQILHKLYSVFGYPNKASAPIDSDKRRSTVIIIMVDLTVPSGPWPSPEHFTKQFSLSPFPYPYGLEISVDRVQPLKSSSSSLLPIGLCLNIV